MLIFIASSVEGRCSHLRSNDSRQAERVVTDLSRSSASSMEGRVIPYAESAEAESVYRSVRALRM